MNPYRNFGFLVLVSVLITKTNSRATHCQMNLQVHIGEARDLPARDSNGLSDPYVHLQLGSTKYRTSVVYKSLNPKWNEKFVFKVENLQDDLVLTLWDEDRFVDDFLGQLKVPVQSILEADKQKVPTSWHTLQKRYPFSKAPVSGELLVGMSLSGKYCLPPISPTRSEESSQASSAGSRINSNDTSIDADSISGQGNPKENAGSFESLMKSFTDLFIKGPEFSSPVDDSGIVTSKECSQTGTTAAVNDIKGETLIESFFDDSDIIPITISMDSLPPPLSGGILLDCSYAATVKALNAIIFKPRCQFYQEFLSLQSASDTVEGLWKKSEDGCLQRIVTYKAATKLVKKMVNVTEEQTYVMADKTGFAVMRRVSIPDVLLGSSFKTELLFTMTPLSDLPNGSVGSRLTISWGINFLRNIPLKSVIESGARKGLKDTYRQFAELLPKFVDPIDDAGVAAINDKEEIQFSELLKPKSVREMALEYFGNLTVVSTLLMLGFLFLHVILTKTNGRGGLEFWGLDMADSVGEILTTAIVVLQVERLVKMTHHRLHARYNGRHFL